jgi:hypothetical protein
MWVPAQAARKHVHTRCTRDEHFSILPLPALAVTYLSDVIDVPWTAEWIFHNEMSKILRRDNHVRCIAFGGHDAEVPLGWHACRGDCAFVVRTEIAVKIIGVSHAAMQYLSYESVCASVHFSSTILLEERDGTVITDDLQATCDGGCNVMLVCPRAISFLCQE